MKIITRAFYGNRPTLWLAGTSEELNSLRNEISTLRHRQTGGWSNGNLVFSGESALMALQLLGEKLPDRYANWKPKFAWPDVADEEIIAKAKEYHT